MNKRQRKKHFRKACMKTSRVVISKRACERLERVLGFDGMVAGFIQPQVIYFKKARSGQ